MITTKLQESTRTHARGRRRSVDDRGRGIIGFIIALAIAIYGVIALKEVFRARSNAAEMSDFIEKSLGDATRMKTPRDDVHFQLVKKATELGIMGDNPNSLEVVDETSRWRVHFEWDDKLNIPGIDYTWHFVVDKTWTRF